MSTSLKNLAKHCSKMTDYGGGGKRLKADPFADWAATVDDSTGKTYYYNSTTKAVSWEWPPPAGIGVKAEGLGGKDFVASDRFKGRREGAVFKRGPLGVGYYDDAKLTSGALSELPPPFAPSGGFHGKRNGAVFKSGPNGVGYYRDQ